MTEFAFFQVVYRIPLSPDGAQYNVPQIKKYSPRVPWARGAGVPTLNTRNPAPNFIFCRLNHDLSRQSGKGGTLLISSVLVGYGNRSHALNPFVE